MMTIRFARHTNNLEAITAFYTDVVGLQKLGEFSNHDTYNGVFLGLSGENWHIEFTASTEKRQGGFDDDDILVFYLENKKQLQAISTKIAALNIVTETPKNPYWQRCGLMIADPDGYKIVFSMQ